MVYSTKPGSEKSSGQVIVEPSLNMLPPIHCEGEIIRVPDVRSNARNLATNQPLICAKAVSSSELTHYQYTSLTDGVMSKCMVTIHDWDLLFHLLPNTAKSVLGIWHDVIKTSMKGKPGFSFAKLSYPSSFVSPVGFQSTSTFEVRMGNHQAQNIDLCLVFASMDSILQQGIFSELKVDDPECWDWMFPGGIRTARYSSGMVPPESPCVSGVDPGVWRAYDLERLTGWLSNLEQNSGNPNFVFNKMPGGNAPRQKTSRIATSFYLKDKMVTDTVRSGSRFGNETFNVLQAADPQALNSWMEPGQPGGDSGLQSATGGLTFESFKSMTLDGVVSGVKDAWYPIVIKTNSSQGAISGNHGGPETSLLLGVLPYQQYKGEMGQVAHDSVVGPMCYYSDDFYNVVSINRPCWLDQRQNTAGAHSEVRLNWASMASPISKPGCKEECMKVYENGSVSVDCASAVWFDAKTGTHEPISNGLFERYNVMGFLSAIGFSGGAQRIRVEDRENPNESSWDKIARLLERAWQVLLVGIAMAILVLLVFAIQVIKTIGKTVKMASMMTVNALTYPVVKVGVAVEYITFLMSPLDSKARADIEKAIRRLESDIGQITNEDVRAYQLKQANNRYTPAVRVMLLTFVIMIILFMAVPAKADCIQLIGGDIGPDQKKYTCDMASKYYIVYGKNSTGFEVTSKKTYTMNPVGWTSYAYPTAACLTQSCDSGSSGCSADEGYPKGVHDIYTMHKSGWWIFSHYWQSLAFDQACGGYGPESYWIVVEAEFQGPAEEIFINGKPSNFIPVGDIGAMVETAPPQVETMTCYLVAGEKPGDIKCYNSMPQGTHSTLQGSQNIAVRSLLFGQNPKALCQGRAALPFLDIPFHGPIDACVKGQSPMSIVLPDFAVLSEGLDKGSTYEFSVETAGDTTCLHSCTDNSLSIKAGNTSCDVSQAANGGWNSDAKSYNYCAPTTLTMKAKSVTHEPDGRFTITIPKTASITHDGCAWTTLTLTSSVDSGYMVVNIAGHAANPNGSSLIHCNSSEAGMFKLRCEPQSIHVRVNDETVVCRMPHAGSYLTTVGTVAPVLVGPVNRTGKVSVRQIKPTPAIHQHTTGGMSFGDAFRVAVMFIPYLIASVFGSHCKHEIANGAFSSSCWWTWFIEFALIGVAVLIGLFVVYKKFFESGTVIKLYNGGQQNQPAAPQPNMEYTQPVPVPPSDSNVRLTRSSLRYR